MRQTTPSEAAARQARPTFRTGRRTRPWRSTCVAAAVACLAAAPSALAADGHDIVMNGTENGATPCSACHGEDGAGQPSAGFPRLAGLNKAYLLHQLQSFADGSRQNDTMQPIAQALSPEEMQAVASYYAQASAPKAEGEEMPGDKAVAVGQALAQNGDWSNDVPGCGQCHGPAGQGVGPTFPELAGQSATYIVNQLHDWKDGKRKNDPLGLMAGIAGRLGDDQIAAAAAYYASLQPAGQGADQAQQHAAGAAAVAATAGAAATAAGAAGAKAKAAAGRRTVSDQRPDLQNWAAVVVFVGLAGFVGYMLPRHENFISAEQPAAGSQRNASAEPEQKSAAGGNEQTAPAKEAAPQEAAGQGAAGQQQSASAPAQAPAQQPAAGDQKAAPGQQQAAAETQAAGTSAAAGGGETAPASQGAPAATEPASAPAAQGSQTAAAPAAPQGGQVEKAAFTPPGRDEIPDNEFGKMVRFGAEVFRNTQANAGEFVGNALQCENCHLDNGRKADSAPLWAAFVAYPAYRGKNKHVNTFAERLQGCFRYSMNGTPPPLGDKVLVGLQSYAYFLAKGAPVGADMPGRGYPDLPKPESLDRAHGQEVYAQKCALCHGENGEGQKTADGTTVFPPLWGPDSFNWGAGMGSISNAAKFVKANMPLSQGGTLTDKEAWDVAAFVDSHDRPQDPRFTGSVDETRKQFHDTPMSLYGTEVDGVKLGENSPPSGPQHKASGQQQTTGQKQGQ